MLLIYCEINLIFTWSANCFMICNAIDSSLPIFAITDTKLYVPVAFKISFQGVNKFYVLSLENNTY